jgi:protein involved in polysaccharide export with SLBB domain
VETDPQLTDDDDFWKVKDFDPDEDPDYALFCEEWDAKQAAEQLERSAPSMRFVNLATVKVLGPFSKAGSYEWHAGMHASDLIFMAGVPQLNADRFYAELARMAPNGQLGQVEKLNLSKLIFTESAVAPGLGDSTINPLLKPYDQITFYSLPDFKVHRTVTISGQVKRPGPYVITEEHFTLRQIIARAGGLTENAMPKGGIFLRSAIKEHDLSETDLKRAGVNELDPTGRDINQILQRLICIDPSRLPRKIC